MKSKKNISLFNYCKVFQAYILICLINFSNTSGKLNGETNSNIQVDNNIANLNITDKKSDNWKINGNKVIEPTNIIINTNSYKINIAAARASALLNQLDIKTELIKPRISEQTI